MATYNEIFANNSTVLVIRPDLMDAIGDREAIVLNQIEYWLDVYRRQGDTKRHFHDGRWWVWNSAEEWQKQFHIGSLSTVKRTLSKLKSMGLLITSSKYNLASFDQTLWYTIDYDKLKEIMDDFFAKKEAESPENVENTHSVNLTQCSVSICADAECHFDPTYTKDYPDTSLQKISSFKKSVASPSGAMKRISDFDVSLKKSLDNMRKVVKDPKDYEAMKYLTEYFFSAIALRCDKIHHVLSVKQCNNIYATLKERFTPLNKSTEDITWQIQYYLHDFVPRMDTPTMEHFATDGILTIGDYRLQNLDISDEDIDYRAYYISKHPDCLMAQEARKQILASAT